MRKYLYIYAKEYEYQTKWNKVYIADEGSYKKGDYIFVAYEGKDEPMIVMEDVLCEEDQVPYPVEKMEKVKRASTRKEYLEYNKKSISRYILSNLDGNEQLPKDFSLNCFVKNNYKSLKFVDGALDGITYLFTNYEEKTNVTKMICKLLMEKKDPEKLVKKFDRKLKKEYVCTSLNSFDTFLENNGKNIGPGYLFKLANKMVFDAKNTETVKLGLCILSHFDLYEMDKDFDMVLLDELNKMAICEEFSYYVSLYIYPRYKNTNELRFNAVKKVNGWGRVFLIDKIKFDTQDKKEWLFEEGYKNYVDNGYTATYILSLLDIKEIINRSKNNQEDFVNISYILNDSMSSVVTTIDELSNYAEIFDEYLSLKDVYFDDLLFYNTVKNIYEFKKEKHKKALEILESEECYNFLKDKMKVGDRGYCLNIIRSLKDYKYKEIVLDIFRENPVKNWLYLRFLLENDETKEEAIKILSEDIDLDGKTSEKDYVEFLNCLKGYPLLALVYIKKAFELDNSFIAKEAKLLLKDWKKQGVKLPKELKNYL